MTNLNKFSAIGLKSLFFANNASYNHSIYEKLDQIAC